MANKPDKTPSQTNPVSHSGAPDIHPPTKSIIAENDMSKKVNKMTPGELIPPSVQNNPSYNVPSNEGLTSLNNPPKKNKFSENVK